MIKEAKTNACVTEDYKNKEEEEEEIREQLRGGYIQKGGYENIYL